MFKPGFRFAPGYRIEKFLGRGQFGQVWQVAAPGETWAAVKFIDMSEGEGQKEYEGIKRVKLIQQANLMPITAIWQLDEFGKVIEDEPPATIDLLATIDPQVTIDVDAASGVEATATIDFKRSRPGWRWQCC